MIIGSWSTPFAGPGQWPPPHLLLARYAADGALRCQRRFEAAAGAVVAIGPDDSIFVAGRFGGTLDLGGGPLAVVGLESDGFVAKLDADGAHLWSRRFGGWSSYDGAAAVAVDGASDVFIAGYFAGTLELDGVVLTCAGVDWLPDGFVAKLSGIDGAAVWATALGGPSWEMVHALALDPAGGPCAGGFFMDQATIGATTFTSFGSADGFVACWSATGDPQWTVRVGGAEDDEVRALAIGADGAIVAAGEFRGAAAFGDATLTSAGDADVFVAGLAPDGSSRWLRRIGGSEWDSSSGVAFFNLDEVAVAVTFHSVVDLDGTPFVDSGNGDVIVATFDGLDGTLGWSDDYGGPNGEVAMGVAGASGHAFVVGGFWDRTDLGGGEVIGMGLGDGFVLRVPE